MKRFLVLILLLLPASAWATTTVSGTLQNLGTIPVGQNAFVRFWLRGCSGNQPRVNGKVVIASSSEGVFFFDLVANVSGYVTGTIYSTRDSTGLLGGEIECGGSKTAVWYGMQIFVAGKGGPEIAVHARNATTLDLSNITPLTTNPVITAPTGDSTYCSLDGGNGACPGPTGPPGPSTKPTLPRDPVQYVSPNGNDAKDGLSWASAKLTVYKALQSLPGGSSTTAGGGTVLLSGDVSYGGPAANQGMWLMGGGDPNSGSPPSGWLLSNSPLLIECANNNVIGSNARTAVCTMEGGMWQNTPGADLVHPAIWLSALAKGIEFKKIALSAYRMTYVKIGIDSNNNRNALGGTSGVRFDGLTFNHGAGIAGCGPGVDIGANSFFIEFDHLNATGCSGGVIPIVAAKGLSRASGVVTVTTVNPNIIASPVNGAAAWITIQSASDPSFNGSFPIASVTDRTHFTYNQAGPNATSGSGQVITYQAAAINIDPGTGPGAGLVYVNNWNNNGGIFRVVNGSFADIANGTFEGNFVDPTPPPVLAMGASAVVVRNMEVADTLGLVPAVQVNSSIGGSLVSGVREWGVAGNVTLMGGGSHWAPPGSFYSPLRTAAGGIFTASPGVSAQNNISTFIYGGGMDQGRRLFAPTSVISPNIANTNSATWTIYQSGPATITPNVADPASGTNAGRVTGTSGSQASVVFYKLDNTPITIGDVYIYGAWVRSKTANGWSQSVTPISFGFGADGYGNGDTCTPDSAILWAPPHYWQDGQWAWVAGFCKVYQNPSKAGVGFIGIVDSIHTVDFFSPILLHLAAGVKSDNEIREIVNNLSAFPETASAGDVTMLRGQLFRPGSTIFSGLGTPANGVLIYCSDCTIANPCAGSGTGAIAKRLNGVWVCN
jgi:hypothetical protein